MDLLMEDEQEEQPKAQTSTSTGLPCPIENPAELVAKIEKELAIGGKYAYRDREWIVRFFLTTLKAFTKTIIYYQALVNLLNGRLQQYGPEPGPGEPGVGQSGIEEEADDRHE